MSWGKSVFGNLMWGAYTLITVVVLLETCGAAVRMLGGAAYLGPVTALVLAVLVSGGVFLFHQWPAGDGDTEKKGANELLMAEAILAVLFLALGLVMRLGGISAVSNGGAYYEAAVVAEGHSIPETVHGAAYFYLQLLHIIFVLIGNKLAAGIWLQVVLQMLAVLLLYIAVRKLAGVLPAMVMLGFFMCMEPVVQGVFVLSPQPFFLLLFAIGLNFVALCRGKVNNPVLFLLSGIWIGFAGYLDVCGFLLLIFGVGAALEKRMEEISGRSRTVAVIACLMGAVACFLGFILADAFISGEQFVNVLKAWSTLYSPGEPGFDLEWLSSGLIWEIPLFLLMFFGVISYWSNPEREYMSIWMLAACLAATSQYFGILTKDLPASMFLILSLTVLAGVGVRASFGERSAAVVRKASKKSAVKEVSPAVEVKQEEVPIKLPKYLQEPGSTSGIKIPKYLQEEMAISRPAPQAKPVVPEKTEPEKEPEQPETPVWIEEPEQPEIPVRVEEPEQPEVSVQPEVAEPEPDIQDMYGVPERFRTQNTVSSQDNTAGQIQPEPEISKKPEAAVVKPEMSEEPEAAVVMPEMSEKPEAVVAEPEKTEEPEAAEAKTEKVKGKPKTDSSKPGYIENPLPLPKPHQKKVLDYDMELSIDDDCYDYPVDENDDFDIK